MSKFSLPTKGYIFGTILVGTALLVWQLSHLALVDLVFLLVVGALGALAQVLKVEGPTERSSYNISWVLYGFAFLLKGAPAALFVIIIAHLVEWAWHRYPWYIQSFNIGSYAMVITLAGVIYQLIAGLHLPTGLPGLVAILVASAVFTFVNHMAVGLVLRLARGQSFTESGVFDRLTLAIDFTLFGMGAAAGFIWLYNPYAVVLAAIPLYLIYTTLKVPALQRQTQTDPKTGLFNARYFNDALEKELARADRYDRPLTVVVADLDLLRNINNTYGHLAGDAALIGVAGLLKRMVRDYDIVARFGGEEFAILMPETTLEQATPRIEEIRAAIEAARFEVATSVTPLRVTMSFGIAGRGRFGQTPNELIHSADLAVYQAKLAGRNRICRYSAEGAENVASIAPMAGELPAEAPALAPATGETPAPAPTPEPAPVFEPAAPQAQPTVTTLLIQPRPTWVLSAYIAAVTVAAAGMAVAGLWLGPHRPDWLGLGLFTALIFLTEWLAIDIYVRDTSVSTSVAPLLAGTLLFGPLGAVVLSVALAGAAMLKHHSAVNRFVFNVGNHLLAALLGLALARAATSVLTAEIWPVQLAVALAAAGLSYLSSTWLLAGVIDLSSGQPFQTVWAERFRWLWPYYLALGVVAFALVFSYESNGFLGLAVTLVPLLVLRLGQAQYLDHTKTLVSQLRGTNSELQKKTDEISALNEELLLALSRTIDLRDPDVQDHSQHVARYATLIAKEMHLPAERVELVRKAGLLHDIGKLGIPEAILFKPGRLTEQEYEDVKQHATMGAEIVGNCHSLSTLVPFIRHHHERYDGRGYPAGLRGHAIPLEARILSVADTIEAMAADRPYRRGLPAQVIVNEVRDNSGTQFDPLVVAAFCAVIEKHGAAVIVNSAREPRPLAAAPAALGDGAAANGPAAEAFNAMISHLHSREARRYRAVVEDQTDLICRFLPDGTLTFVNDAYCQYFGKTSAELVGRTFMPLIPEEDQAVVTAQVARLNPQQPVATYTHRVILADGSLRWQQWTDRAIFNSQGEIVEFQSVGRDITEQKQAETELQAAYHKLELRNQQLAHILETGNNLRLGLDLDAVLQQIADGIHQALGFEVVAVNLVEQAGQRVRLAAHTGLPPAAQPAFTGGAAHLSWEQSGRHLLQERFRAGGCYFIPGGALDWGSAATRYEPGEANPLSEWQPDDALVVPLHMRSGRLAGLISVDRPADGRRPDAAILQGLEIFANQAVAAIENAWTYEQLQRELNESHQMEAALRESEHRLQLALEAANAGVWSWDIASGQAFWSAENYRVMGLEPGSCPPTFAHWLQRVEPADQARIQAEVERAVEQRQPLDLVYRCVWPNGERRWIRDIGKLECDSAGRPERITGVQIDITSLKRAEDALRDSEQRYRLLAENVTDVIWVRDLNLKPTYISPSVQRLRGFSAEEALAQSLAETLAPESAALAEQFFAEMLHSARHWPSERLPFQSRRLTLEVRRRDGSTVWTESRVSFLADEHGQPTAILGVTRDLHDRE